MNCCRCRTIFGLLLFFMVASVGFHEYFTLKRSFLSVFQERLSQSNQLLRRTLDRQMTNHQGYSLWPKDRSETDDRITEQINFMNSLNKSGDLKTTSMKIIYYEHHWNYGGPPSEGQQLFISQRCPVQACSITTRQSDVKKADAIFMQSFQTSMLKYLLPKRPSQLWIMSGGEAPVTTARRELLQSRGLRNLVNWTMMYRRDATISIPNGKFETFPNFTKLEDYFMVNEKNYASGKTKKVAWLVSNCNTGTNSGRKAYADELSKYIQVDIYGQCSQLKCPKEKMDECLRMLRTNYKFYLAFENNCCKDYITEKFFRNALTNDVLPIVLGASPDDYKAISPPGSFIHVDDFESPKQLAEYLHLLDRNDTLYNEYFRWKKTGRFIGTQPWCRLCALLHANDEMKYVHWYPDFYDWWEHDTCRKNPPAGKWQSWRNKTKRYNNSTLSLMLRRVYSKFELS